MAKKLNKKVAVIGISLLALLVIGSAGLAFRHFYHRDPDRNLDLARQALADNDFESAERYLSRAYRFANTDADKIERLFELADLHLTHNQWHEANWDKALRSWNTVLNIDPKHLQAHREMLTYFYDYADSGAAAAWSNVHDRATELIELLEEKGESVDVTLQNMVGRASLSIARIGGIGTTERINHLNEAIDVYERLIEREPSVTSHYTYLVDALLLQGQLNEQMGVMDARQRAQSAAMRRLDEAFENADNKGQALAARYAHELQDLGNDPERIETLRQELEAHSQSVDPSAELLTVLSQAYELPGQANAEAELNRAIEAARQASRLAPDNFEYAYRLMLLLYRKGSAFEDAAAMEDALALAEEMQSMPQTQPIPGPREGRNLAYRNALNVFLARCYLEHALDRPDETPMWIAKAEPRVNQISQYHGTSEHTAVQQWEGILALAKGERDRAIRLLYRAYEQSTALDTSAQRSSVDPILCVVLARIARQDNQIGLEREFLEKALSNRVRIVLDKPSLMLDYAELMARFQAWNPAVSFAQSYQQRYGANERSRTVLTEAALALGETDPLTEAIAARAEGTVDRTALELRFVSSQIQQTSRRLAQLDPDGEDASDELRDDLASLRSRQQQLLFDLIERAPDKVEASLLQSVCIHYLQSGKPADAIALLDAYLAQRPDAVALRVLRLQAEEPDPLSIPRARYEAIQMEAIEHLDDLKQKAMLKADLYRSHKDYDNALEMLIQAGQTDQDDDADVIQKQFELAFESENIEAAEQLLRVMRSRNLDGCEGNLSSAQVEMLKNNYSLALRRVNECLTVRPLMSHGYYLKSRIHQELDDLESAIENSREAIRMNPLSGLYAKNHASLLFNRNAALATRVTSDQQNELIQSITTAMYLNPNDWQLQSLYAEVISTVSPDRGLSLRQQLLQLHPTVDNAMLLGNMALRMAQNESDVAKKSGLIELSGKAFSRAIEIDPANASAKASYADYLSQTHQADQAEALLRDDKNLLWRFYLQNGQFDQANEILLQFYQADAEDTSVLRGLILAAEGLGDRDAQKQYLDSLAAAELDKDNLLWLIQKYLDGGYAEEGGTLLDSAKDHYPDEKLVLLMDAWLKMTHGQLQEALALTNRYMDIDSGNPGAWRLRGRLHRLMNEPRRAVEDLQRSKGLNSDPAVSMELAAVFSELGQVDAAARELIGALQNPQAPLQVRLMLETLYQRNNRHNDLSRFYTQTLEQYPDSAFWSRRAGIFYFSQNDTAQAVRYLQRAWDIQRRQDSIDPSVLNLYLEAMNQNGRHNDVINVASELIDGPLAPVAYAQMAQAHYHQDRSDRAESFFTLALDKSGVVDLFQDMVLSIMFNTVGQEPAVRWTESHPDTLPSLLVSYRIARQNEQFNRGIDLIDQCLAQVTPDSSEWGNLAMKKANLLVQAYMQNADMGYLNRALDVFQQVHARYPENPSILNNLAYLLAVNDQQLDLAMQYARRAHQHDPGNPIYLDTYAYTQYKNGDLEQSRQNLLRALQLFEANRRPIPWDVYNHLGLVHESLGETAQALDNFRKALDAASDAPEKEQKGIEERINNLKQQANTSI